MDNTKCQNFCRRRGLSPRSLPDAFLLQWNRDLLCAFPVPVVPRVISKIKRVRATTIPVVLYWLRQFWLIDLSQMTI